MSYFIFIKNSDNIEGTLYKIAENQSDLNNLNINQSDYKIIEDSQENFNQVKYKNKHAIKYNNNVITYINYTYDIPAGVSYSTKELLKNYVNYFRNEIKNFLDNNKNHQLYNRWNDYMNQLNNLDLNNVPDPLNKSLEQYFSDLGQPSLNPLQIP